MKTLRNLFAAALATAAIIFTVGCPTSPETPPEETVEAVTFNPASGQIPSGDSVQLVQSQGHDVYYTKVAGETGTVMTDDNAKSLIDNKTATLGKSVKIDADTTIYAVAISDSGKLSKVSSAEYKVVFIPTKPTFTPSAAKDSQGLYASGTTVKIESTSTAGDVTIYYSTTEELTSGTAEKNGKIYVASGDDATVITISDVLTLSAIAKNANGWSEVTTETFSIPLTYSEGAYDFDGNIAAALTAIGTSTDSVTFSAPLDISGIVTSAGSSGSSKPTYYVYIQDKDSGIQIYGGIEKDQFAVGDYVEVKGAATGQIYPTSGVPEITKIDSITKNPYKSRRNIYFEKIPSYVTDFEPYLKGGTLLKAFRGKTNEHTTAPNRIYTYNGATENAEKINLGAVVNASSGIQFSLWSQLDADDKILSRDTPAVENVTFTPSAQAKDGYYDANTTVTLATTTSGAEIYYKLNTRFSTTADTSSLTKYTAPIQISDDTVIYAIAVKGSDRSQVNLAEYLTKFDFTYEEYSETNNYSHDGGLKALFDSKSAETDKTYSGYIVAFNGDSKKQFYVQDKNAGLYFYNVNLPANARVGSLIEFTISAGGERNGQYQVNQNGATVTVKTAKAQNKIYYKNLTGVNDWSSYQTGQLCGVRGIGDELGSKLYQQYNSDTNVHAFFGWVYTYNSALQLQRLVVETEEKISYPENYIATPRFDPASGGIAQNTQVKITCAYPTSDVKIYYKFVAGETIQENDKLTAENYSTVGTEYSSESDYKVGTAGTLQAIAVSTDGTKKSEVATATYTLLASNEEELQISAGEAKGGETVDGASNKAENTKTYKALIISFASGAKLQFENSGGFSPRYDNSYVRFYAKNTLQITGKSGKSIKSITIPFKALSTESGAQITADSGTWSLDSSTKTGTWTASSDNAVSSVLLTYSNATKGNFQIETIKIVYND